MPTQLTHRNGALYVRRILCPWWSYVYGLTFALLVAWALFMLASFNNSLRIETSYHFLTLFTLVLVHTMSLFFDERISIDHNRIVYSPGFFHSKEFPINADTAITPLRGPQLNYGSGRLSNKLGGIMLSSQGEKVFFFTDLDRSESEYVADVLCDKLREVQNSIYRGLALRSR